MLCLMTVPLPTVAAAGDRPVIVIVHGAWGGGWAFRDVEQRLRARGYVVYRPTLTGQGERVHLASQDVDLDTHIEDVTNTLQFEDLHDIILVGHSYGGIVATGVADREPDRIRHLIYLDALIPEDGDSWRSLSGVEGAAALDEMIGDEGLVPPWISPDDPRPKDVPHPTGSYEQPIRLSGAAANIPASYVLTAEDESDAEVDEFFGFAEVARSRDWPVYVLESDHNPQWSNVDGLTEMLDMISRQAE
jgi:pimeloyl-ACP methyl ester carboxylesterase